MMAASNVSYMNYDPRIVEIKSKFECEFRRFSVDRAQMTKFTEFYLLVKELHCLPDEINFTTSYTDPRNGDLLPINNDDNLLRAYSTAMPLLRLFIYREQDLMLADMQCGSKRRNTNEKKQKPLLAIGTPKDFRKVSSIIDVDMLPDTLRRVKLLKPPSDERLGFYIRISTSARVTPYGLEKVPGIFISQLIPGELAERTGLLAVNDEILEVNGIEVTGKRYDQVQDMITANIHNLILTVKPANQPGQTSQPQNMVTFMAKLKANGQGNKIDGLKQLAKVTSRSHGDIPSAIPSTPKKSSSKKGYFDPSTFSGIETNSPSHDQRESSHLSRSRSLGPEITLVYDNDSDMHTSLSSHQAPSNPNGNRSSSDEETELYKDL